MTLRTVMPATAMMATGLLLATACGGTLEGKYRRGELTTTTTTTGATGGARSTVTTPSTVGTTPTTSTTPTSGNAAGQRTQGEPERLEPGGTIVESATRRTVVPPLGGRHR